MKAIILIIKISNISLSMFCSYLAETGLVSVEHQMQEMGLGSKDVKDGSKKSN